MSAVMFDTLKFTRRLKDVGVSERQAEAEAEAISDAMAEALHTEIARKSDIQKSKTELKDEIQALRAELKDDMQASKTELKEDIHEMKADLRLIRWILGLVVLVEIIPLLQKVL